MTKTFWLRAETKEFEYRRCLSPDSVKKLINAGHKVIVEKSKASIIQEDEYHKAGAEIVEENSWINDAPIDAIIVGLKALPNDLETYKHTHIYFAHAYKEQDGWKEVIGKFQKGGGRIIDLEFMVDENSRRVCAFGYWAGYVGAALASLFSDDIKQNDAIEDLKNKRYFIHKEELISFVKKYSLEKGKGIVLGSMGRSGHGAMDLLKDIKWNAVGWDKNETQNGGPFPEILNYDIFVNCVLAMTKMPPFLTHETLQHKHKLKVISDVSCDPDSDKNVLPLYNEATDLDDPILKIAANTRDISLVAIDNLPSILPKESTFDFSNQLEQYLIDYTESSGPLKNSLDLFNQIIDKI